MRAETRLSFAEMKPKEGKDLKIFQITKLLCPGRDIEEQGGGVGGEKAGRSQD